MPKLKCSVSNCAHHCDDLCCLNHIGVGADHADNPEETCCTNFMEQSGATNSAENPNDALDVGCHAENCTFNENHQCSADSIDISGQGACNCTDTCCSSFCER